jgi:hypothetical protein
MQLVSTLVGCQMVSGAVMAELGVCNSVGYAAGNDSQRAAVAQMVGRIAVTQYYWY